ncbi:MAG: hypothetical protein JO283_19390 [Bradyrhizobium sp.]|nr:hypothetical protein [Bradyrhizobium sp.]
MKFAHFTSPDGKKVGINPDHVVSDRDAEPGVDAPGAKCVMTESSGFQAVKETCAEVEKKLESD